MRCTNCDSKIDQEDNSNQENNTNKNILVIKTI